MATLAIAVRLIEPTQFLDLLVVAGRRYIAANGGFIVPPLCFWISDGQRCIWMAVACIPRY
jgi:hypothetical protein